MDLMALGGVEVTKFDFVLSGVNGISYHESVHVRCYRMQIRIFSGTPHDHIRHGAPDNEAS